MRRLGTVVSGLGLLVAIVVFTGPAASAAPALAVDPATDLVDGQVVTVTVTGLTPNSVAGMAQCVEGYLIDGCDLSTITQAPTDATGSFTASVTLNAQLSTPVGAIDCRTTSEQCVIGANTGYQIEGAVWAPVHFDPAGPLRPAPTVTVEPAADLADRQQVIVRGHGFAPSTFLTGHQCPAGASSIDQCAIYPHYTTALTDGTGAFETVTVVPALFVDGFGGEVDCRPAPGDCALVFGSLPATNRTGRVDLSFDPTTPVVRPAIQLTPDADLVDRQLVTVTGTDFPVGSPVGISQCEQPQGACIDLGLGIADPAGSFTVDVRVRARLWFGLDIIDCRVVECVLEARAYDAFGDVAILPLPFDPDGPVVPPPTATATPSDALVDGQVVTVAGTGFELASPYPRWPLPSEPAPAYATGYLCQGHDPSFGRCSFQTSQGLAVDEDGNLDGVFQVEAVFVVQDGTTVDCRVPGSECELRVGDPGDPLRTATVALGFDPDAPLAPPPTVTVTPADDLVDGQTVTVSGTGYPVNRPALVEQCVTSGQFAGVCTNFGRITMVGTDGELRFDVQVKATVPFLIGGIDCTATPGACEIVVRTFDDEDAHLRVPLSFRSAAPPPEPPPPPPIEAPPDVEVSPLTTQAVRPAFTG